MSRFTLLQDYLERELGLPLESLEPRKVSGWDAVEALWPLNDRFRLRLAKIKSLPYDPIFEAEADSALEAWANGALNWDSLSGGAWRVLLERHQQGIVVACANEAAGNNVMLLPPGLRPAQRTIAVALYLLHSMPLPWPPEDRGSLQIPKGSARATLRPH